MSSNSWLGLKAQRAWNGEENQVVVCLDEITRTRLSYILKSENIGRVSRLVSYDKKHPSIHRYFSALVHEQFHKLKKIEKEIKKRIGCIEKPAEETKSSLNERLQNLKKRKLNSVYLIKDKSSGYTKIGITTNVDQRFKSIRSGNPTVDLIFSHPAENRAEKELHKIFKRKNIAGEWFDLTDEQIETAKMLLSNLCDRITGSFNSDFLYEYLLKENPTKNADIGERARQLAAAK